MTKDCRAITREGKVENGSLGYLQPMVARQRICNDNACAFSASYMIKYLLSDPNGAAVD